MKKHFTLSLAFLGAFVFGQFSTPNSGQTYTIEDLDLLTEAITYDAVNNKYILTEDLTISANDTFLAENDFTLAIENGKLITVAGAIQVNAPNQVHFTSTNPGNHYFNGIRIQDGATANFTNFKMTYGGGIRVLGENFFMNQSEVSYQNAGVSTGAAINFSKGNPIIKNSRFVENITPVVASGANQSVALTFEYNYFYHNNLENSNRPQINMGPSGNGVTVIRGNQIIGDRNQTKVGGISVSSMLGVNNEFLIEDNLIQDNRYGITTTGGNTKGNILNNQIIDNNTEPIPLNGGSGINIYLTQNASTNVINILGNQIKGNLWGITSVGNGAYLNLGEAGNLGNNYFENNGNEGETYALYNNTPNPISALGNCWDPINTMTRAEQVIFHSVDNPILGTVDFSIIGCQSLGLADVTGNKTKLYPNPNSGQFYIETDFKQLYYIYDVTGKLVASGELKTGKNNIKTSLKKGTYLLKTNTSKYKIVIK